MIRFLLLVTLASLLAPTLAPIQVADPAAAQVAEPAVARPADTDAPEPSAAARLHAPFDRLLKAHVSDGVVDYAGLKRAVGDLDGYLTDLSKVEPASLDKPSRFAFWINAYNAFTLKLILERYPKLESIRDIPGGDRWDAERWPVHGELFSLTAIEHEILRPMGDPRIHFAINCASKSCPDLSSDVYLPETLDAQLDAATRDFLTDPVKGLRTEIDAGFFGTDYELQVSKLFDWFEEDFEQHSGNVPDYVLPFASKTDAAFIRAHREDLDLEFLDYDWTLNGR